MAYIESHKGQRWLFPPAVEDLIPKDHVCYIVESFVESLDFSKFDIKYAGAGHPAYHPRIILKILTMGFIDKIRSSRNLARNARENVIYIYLSEKLAPDFRTISDFRKENPDLIKEAFKHTVIIAKNEGILDLSTLNTDGTKIKANAANRSALTSDELLFLSNFIDNEIEEWIKQDKLEDEFFGDIRGSDQLPLKSKKKMKKAVQYYIRKLKEGEIDDLKFKIKKAKQEVKKNNLKRVSLTDPESRFMKSKKGRIELSYNTQITTDNKGFILANDVCQDEADNGQLQPQILQTEENLREIPKGIPWNFDKGYRDGENIAFALAKKIDLHMACQEKKKKDCYEKEMFIYDKENDEYICPEDKRLIFLSNRFYKRDGRFYRWYRGQSCKDCLKKSNCTKNEKGIRYIQRQPFEEEGRKLKEKMKTKKAREIYARRRETVEPVFGDIKENKGMRGFLTRDIKDTKTEWNLACISTNLKKIHYFKRNLWDPT